MKKAPWFIIGTLLIVIFLQRIWLPSQKAPKRPQKVTIYDTIHDTVPYPVTRYVPKPVYKDTGSTKWKWHKVDTAAILKDYYSRHYYVDTLADDSIAFIIIRDTVSRNRIISRQKQLMFYPSTIKETTIRKIPNNKKLYVGLSIGRNPKQFALSPSILYTSRKDNAYAFSYDILNHDMYLSMYWKIRFK